MPFRKRLFFPFLFLAPLFISSGCSTGKLIGVIDKQLASPIAVAVDVTKNRAYVVNSNNNFEFTNTTFSILDITDPVNPLLLNSPVNPISIPNFSGQIFFDATKEEAIVTNRVSDNPDDKVDLLLQINLDEASADFGKVTTFAGGENPFGIACCDSSGRLYVASSGGTLSAFDPNDLSSSIQVSLAVKLKSGEAFSGKDSTEVVLLGDQAFVSNRHGRIFVINTTEVGDPSKNPIDYILLNGVDFRGIATDGTSIFAVDGDTKGPILRIINPSSLIPVNPDVPVVNEVDISTIQTGSVSLGKDPNEVTTFQGKAYVSNRGDNTVSVIDIATKALVTTIVVGKEPFGLTAFTSNSAQNLLYVTNLISDSLSIIDIDSNTLLNTFVSQ